jgi:hypothetical protein
VQLIFALLVENPKRRSMLPPILVSSATRNFGNWEFTPAGLRDSDRGHGHCDRSQSFSRDVGDLLISAESHPVLFLT